MKYGIILVLATLAVLVVLSIGKLAPARADPPPTPPPGVVYGDDGRTQPADSEGDGYKEPPWRMIAHLVAHGTGFDRYCTGWFAGPKLVLTAAHCLTDDGPSFDVDSVDVVPGRNAGALPYGTLQVARGSLRKAKCWTGNNAPCDYAGIILSAPAGIGSFTPKALTDVQLQGKQVEASGYPADKPAGTLWTMPGPISATNATNLRYDMDTFGSQSGSPVWYKDGDVYYSVGIHVGGDPPNEPPDEPVEGPGDNDPNYCDPNWIDSNCAVRITDAVLAEVRGWLSVGGLAELPEAAESAGSAATQPGSSAGTYAALTGAIAAAVLVLTAGAWYARRRLSRS